MSVKRTSRRSSPWVSVPLITSRTAIRAGLAALAFASVVGVTTLFAPSALACDSYVSGYYRSNGTYVNGYYRSCSNSTVTDNYTFKGNTNPYTYDTGTDYYRAAPLLRTPAARPTGATGGPDRRR